MRRTVGSLLAWSALVLVLCPALLDFSMVDLPDEYLEFNVSGLSYFADGLSDGRVGWWNPYKHGGGATFADPTCLAPFYPMAALLALLPLDVFVLLAWVLHLGTGAAGMQRWAEELGAGRAGAVVAGLAVALGSGPVVALVDGQLDHLAVLAWLPWVLALLQRRFRRMTESGAPARGLGQVALIGLLLGLIGLGAHARFAAIAFATAGLAGGLLWLLPPGGRRPRPAEWALTVAGALVLGAALAAPVLLPTALELGLTRADAPPGAGGLVGQALPWRGLTGLVHPRALVVDERWYHLGPVVLLPLALAVREARLRAALVTGLVLLLMGMGAAGPLALLTRPIRWLLYPVETGVAAMSLPFLAVAAGLAVDRLVRDSEGETRRAGALAAFVAVAGLALVGLGTLADMGLYSSILEGPRRLALQSAAHGGLAVASLALILAAGRRLGARRLALCLLVLTLADGLAYGWRVQAAIPSPRARPSEFVAPPPTLAGLERSGSRVLAWPLEAPRDRAPCLDSLSSGHGWGRDRWSDPTAELPDRAARVLAGPLHQNAGAASGIPRVGGRAKVPPMPWSVLTWWLSDEGPVDLGTRAWMPRDREAAVPDRADCRPDGPLNLGSETEADWLPSLLEVLHVRWVLTTRPVETVPGARPIRGASGALRFQLDDPRPIALLSPELQRVASIEAAEELIFARGTDLRRTAVVLGDRAEMVVLGSGQAPATAEVTARHGGAWTVHLPPEGGLLTVAERHHPGWQARADDGRRLETVAANLVQLGVVVPSGVNRVELRFRPPGLGVGLGVGGLAIAVLLLLLAGSRRLPVVEEPP